MIPVLQMDGLGDYSRNDGYVKGSVDLHMESVKFNYDRGRKFTVDAMDNEETTGLAFGKLSSEFVRTKATPEMDAFRFAKYASTEGISVASGDLANGEAVLAALVAASSKMDEDGVPESDRHLKITPALLNAVKAVDTTKSREVLDSFTTIKKVPQSRFYTAIDLKSGKDGDELSGGYAKAADAKDINFMIIHKPTIMQYPKHTQNKCQKRSIANIDICAEFSGRNSFSNSVCISVADIRHRPFW